MADNSLFHNDVWGRVDDATPATMGRRAYLLAVTGFTAVGVAVSAMAAQWAGSTIRLATMGGWGMLGFTLVLFLIALGATWVAASNTDPLISGVAFFVLAIAFGVLLSPVVALYTAASVAKILALTTMLVIGLGLIGAFIPQGLSSWGMPLLGLLLLLIVGQFGVLFLGMLGVPVTGAMTALDWLGLVLFSAMVIFDLNRALRIPYTLDNAIDSAMAVYLDFINIFIRLLSLFGQKK